MTLTDTVSSVQGQVLEGLTAIQSPIVDIVKQAVEAINGVLPTERPEVPFLAEVQPGELVDKAFGTAESLLENQSDFAEKVLANQHAFVNQILAALQPLLPTAPKKVAKPKVAKATAAA